MNVPIIKFSKTDRPEFFKELNKRVNKHFAECNISKYANFNMKFKTCFMLSLYFIPFILMIGGVVSSFPLVLLMWVIMGFGMSGIGLSIMHDANHGSYSKNVKVNTIIGFLINFIGGFHVNWKIQHNVLHHSYTNVHEFDDDIHKEIVMRFSPNQKKKKQYRFQAYYAPIIYSLMTIYWLTAKDFQQLFKYEKKNLLKSQGYSFSKSLVQIIFHKTWYVLLFVVLPILVIQLPWYKILLGFVLMHLICGLILALIFQPAHVIQETDFFVPDENLSLENHWAIHQMKTTANFANESRFFSWFIGGLNYQIEHHLFPNICHVHYKNISKIVKKTAEEFGVPYYQHKTYYSAVKSHFLLLNQLGRGVI